MGKNKKTLVLDLDITDSGYQFASNINDALSEAELELNTINERLSEDYYAIEHVTPNCDKSDYILASSCGALCSIIDIFFVGRPGESPLGNITDEWFKNRTKDFAKLCGWEDNGSNNISSAVRYLERRFKVPYDQRGAGDAASFIFDLNPKNHHFKSLAHNPTLLGLFFSILDQFNNTSHFVSGGELISLQNANPGFELQGNNFSSKFYCAFINWIGHLFSDVSGSSGSKSRGMGIPSPLWSWINDIIALKRKLNIPVTEFDNSFNELALNIYKEEYDVRFQTAQALSVFINELLVRTVYSVRRLIRYFSDFDKSKRVFSLLWKTCEPFSNASVKRMLTISHGTFCLIDLSDAIIRGVISGKGNFDVSEFVMRLNIVGLGRLGISLYGEGNNAFIRHKLSNKIYDNRREMKILNYYVEGLRELSNIYDDVDLLTFVTDLENSEMYRSAFDKSVLLAEKRNVDSNKILRNKSDIDSYFRGE